MFYSIRRLLARILRIPRTRGFGVQSPFAYYFIRHVVLEHSLYYSYSSLEAHGGLNVRTRSIGRLLFRLSNFVGRKVWFIPHKPSLSTYQLYIHLGSWSSTFTFSPHVSYNAALVYAHSEFIEHFSYFQSCSVLVVLGIHNNRNTSNTWKRLVNQSNCSVAFDLFDLGIVFFDQPVVKNTYKVNY